MDQRQRMEIVLHFFRSGTFESCGQLRSGAGITTPKARSIVWSPLPPVFHVAVSGRAERARTLLGFSDVLRFPMEAHDPIAPVK
jgi:hypothetical protein